MDAQADLHLCYSHMAEDRISHDEAYMQVCRGFFFLQKKPPGFSANFCINRKLVDVLTVNYFNVSEFTWHDC